MKANIVAGLFALCVVSLPIWADKPASAPKTAVPDAAALKNAQELVSELYARDIAKANKPDEKLALSKKILQVAIETKNDAAGRYALLSMARDLAASAGDADTGFCRH